MYPRWGNSKKKRIIREIRRWTRSSGEEIRIIRIRIEEIKKEETEEIKITTSSRKTLKEEEEMIALL